MTTTPTIVTVSLNPSIDRVIGVDNFTIGAHQIGRDVMRIAGGKAINVSRVLASLGVRNIATGFLGTENRSIFDDMTSDPLIMDEFFFLPGRTRENVTIVDHGQETHIRMLGLEVDVKNLERLKKKLQLIVRPGSIVIFSGSLPPGIGPEDFAGLVKIITAVSARAAIDTSGPALRRMFKLPVWLLKPNVQELRDLTGEELATLSEQLIAAKAQTAYAALVLLTRGPEGAFLFTQELALHAHVDIPREQVANTVGCGDALLGAFVAAVARGGDIRAALREGIACASASACMSGPAEFTIEKLAELREKVQIAELPADLSQVAPMMPR